MRVEAYALALALVTVGLSGCLGASNDDPGESLQKQRAVVTDTTGGIQGIVTDNAVQPVIGVTVRIPELDFEVVTDDDGSYAFSSVPPGEYRVAVNASAFVAASQAVEVRAGSVATVDFVLIHLFTDEAFVQSFEFAGFVECAPGWGWDLRPELAGQASTVDQTVNATAGDDPHLRDRNPGLWHRNALAACAVPNIAAENTTNDRFLQAFEAEAPVESLVYALSWENGNGQADRLWTILEVFPFYNDDDSYLFRKIGPSPVELHLTRDVFERAQANFTEECEDGNDNYCGYSFFDEGWPLVLRIFPFWTCVTDKAGVCGTFQQPFTHFVDVYYNAAAPVGASAASGV